MGKEYKVKLPFLLFNYLIILVLTVFAILLFFIVFLDPVQKARLFAGIWSCSIFVFALPFGLQLTHTISLDEPGRLIFKSLLFRKAFEASDILSIKTGIGGGYFLYFEFRKGKVAVLNSVGNLSGLISTIKGLNPAVQTIGL
jgi:hypothetical protein